MPDMKNENDDFLKERQELVAKAAGDAHAARDAASRAVRSLVFWQNAHYVGVRACVVASVALNAMGMPLPSLCAFAYGMLSMNSGLRGLRVSWDDDSRTTRFFHPVEDEDGDGGETWADRMAEEGGLPVRKGYILLSPVAAGHLANAQEEILAGVMASAIPVSNKSTLSSAGREFAPDPEKLSDIFARAVTRRESGIARGSRVAANLWEDVTKKGFALGLATAALGCMFANPAMLMAGMLVALAAALPKSDPFRGDPAEVPETRDPDISGCRTKDGDVLFGMSARGAARIATADPAMMDFLVTETHRLLAKKPEAPTPAPK